MPFPEIDSITLGGGHSIILSHKPSNITPEMVDKKASLEKKSTQSFGLFDNSTPNYATYYPEVTAEDLKPKDEEFIYPVFRMLSEATVHKQHNPIDFSRNNVLKNSMAKLKGQTVNIDHETALGNAIGSVMDVFWQKAYTTSDGIEVPAGINATLKIDGKSNPRIARGILMDPPSIHSNSVTVRFKWEQSHPDMDQNEFYEKLGTFDAKGNQVMRVVTEIVSYHETSLVAHGADPFAQIINDDGKINNPKYADAIYNFSADSGKVFKGTKYFELDYKNDIISNSSIPNNLNNQTNNNQNQILMKEKLQLLAAVIGLTGTDTLTEENFSEVIEAKFKGLSDQLIAANAAKETAEGKVNELTTANQSLTAEVERLKPLGTAGEAALTASRNEAVRLYKLAVGEDKADANLLKLMNEADLTTADSFKTTYQEQVDAKFEAKCQKCGSTEVNRMSAKNEGGAGDGSHKPLSNSELREKLTQNKQKVSPILTDGAN